MKLKEIKDIINAIKDNTYNLPKEFEFNILSLLYKELENINCSPTSNCEYAETRESSGNNYYNIYCSYLNKSKQKKLYDFNSLNYINECPYNALKEEVNSLLLKRD